MTNRDRGDGWPLIKSQCGARSARLAGNAIATEMFCGIFLTTRLHRRVLLREFTFPRITLGNSCGGRACCTAQTFSRRERHCTHGVGIGSCLEYGDGAHARDQAEDHEGKYDTGLAKESRNGAKIPELGVQSACYGHRRCPMNPWLKERRARPCEARASPLATAITALGREKIYRQWKSARLARCSGQEARELTGIARHDRSSSFAHPLAKLAAVGVSDV
jgi:hypothetical protein